MDDVIIVEESDNKKYMSLYTSICTCLYKSFINCLNCIYIYRTQEDDDNDVCIMSIQKGESKRYIPECTCTVIRINFSIHRTPTRVMVCIEVIKM